MQNKKVAVIGGSGFIGTRLCDLLAQRDDLEFSILDIQKSEKYPTHWIKADVREPDTLVKGLEGHDVVINLAAEHKDNITPKSRYYETNVDGQRNICNAMDTLGIKQLIFTSSVAVYGFVTEDTGEDGAINPFHEYGDSKYKAEEVAEEWFSDEKKLTIVRPTVVFGENNRGNVYNLLKQIASGKFLMVGSGKNKKSMAYVRNVAAFLGYLIDHSTKHQIFNYVDKPDFDMNTLVETVNKSLGKNKSTTRVPFIVGLAGGYAFDLLSLATRKKYSVSSVRVKKFCARTQFRSNTDMNGFEKPFSLEQGLTMTVEHEFLLPNNGPIVSTQQT